VVTYKHNFIPNFITMW